MLKLWLACDFHGDCIVRAALEKTKKVSFINAIICICMYIFLSLKFVYNFGLFVCVFFFGV